MSSSDDDEDEDHSELMRRLEDEAREVLHVVKEQKRRADELFSAAENARTAATERDRESTQTQTQTDSERRGYAEAALLYASIVERLQNTLPRQVQLRTQSPTHRDRDRIRQIERPLQLLVFETVSATMNLACCELQTAQLQSCVDHCASALRLMEDERLGGCLRDIDLANTTLRAKYFKAFATLSLYQSNKSKLSRLREEDYKQDLMHEVADIKELLEGGTGSVKKEDVRDCEELIAKINNFLGASTDNGPPSPSSSASVGSSSVVDSSSNATHRRTFAQVLTDISKLDRRVHQYQILELLEEMKIIVFDDDYLYAKCCFHSADLLFRNDRPDDAFAEYEQSVAHFRKVLKSAEDDETMDDLLPVIEVSLATTLRDFSQCIYLRGSSGDEDHNRDRYIVFHATRDCLFESIELLEENIQDYYDLFLHHQTTAIEKLELLRIPSHGNIRVSLTTSEPTLSEIALVLAYSYETIIDLFCKAENKEYFAAFNIMSRSVHFYWLLFGILYSEDLWSNEIAQDGGGDDAAVEKSHEVSEREKELRRHLKMITMLLRKKYANILMKLSALIQLNVLPDDGDLGEISSVVYNKCMMPASTIEGLNEFSLLEEVKIPRDVVLCFQLSPEQRMERLSTCYQLAGKELEDIFDYPLAFTTYRQYGEFLLDCYDIKSFQVVSLSHSISSSSSSSKVVDEEIGEHCHNIWRLVSKSALKLCSNRTLSQQDYARHNNGVQADPNYLLVTWKLEAMIALYQAGLSTLASHSFELAKRALESAETLGKDIQPVLLELQKKDDHDVYNQLIIDYCVAMSDASFHLGHCYLKLGKNDAAVEAGSVSLQYLAQCTDQVDSVQVRMKHTFSFLAIANSVCGNIEDAEKALEKMIENCAGHSESTAKEVQYIKGIIEKRKSKDSLGTSSSTSTNTNELRKRSTKNDTNTSQSQDSSLDKATKIAKHLLSTEPEDKTVDYNLIMSYAILISFLAVAAAILVKIYM